MAQLRTGTDSSPPRVQSSSTDEVKILKNRPKTSKLRQQKLPAWQPILTACTAIPVFFAIAVFFIPTGVFILLAAESVKEYTLEYGSRCTEANCTLEVELVDNFLGNVYFYYGLDNYFQNHRRYVKSRSDAQLLGDLTAEVTAECAPLHSLTIDNVTKPIAPCGAIANSMFNDTFKLMTSEGDEVPLTIEGVVWEVDRDVKFKNPKGAGDLCEKFQGTYQPPNWKKRPCELDKENPDNNGFQNVDFIVWMRTAALPSFKKLYRLLDRNKASKFKDGLPAGKYKLMIENYYPVDKFSGKKSFIISTTAWTGGRNIFLGVAYIVIGSICIVLGVAFSVIHLKLGYSFAEMADGSLRRAT